MYVGNLDLSTTEDDLLGYLKKKLPDDKFAVEILPKRVNARSIAFKVTVHSNRFSSLMDESFWAAGVKVKKFYFLRKKSEGATVLSIQVPLISNVTLLYITRMLEVFELNYIIFSALP